MKLIWMKSQPGLIILCGTFYCTTQMRDIQLFGSVCSVESPVHVLNNNIIGWGFCDIQDNQGQGRGG